jgi:hypothetical protein
MSTDIFCVTVGRDAVWTEYMLRSVQKYARGFRRTVVICPKGEEEMFEGLCRMYPNTVLKTLRPGDEGHYDQLVAKTSCDLFTDSDFVLHIDSDCLFTEKVTPEDYSTDGKPDLWYDFYVKLVKEFPWGAPPWQKITENALGFPTEVETMRRFPIVYPIWLYKATRQVIEQHQGTPFESFVRSAPKLGGAFRGYCEFNALGGVAYYKYPEHFCLKPMAEYCLKPPKLKQFWSHAIWQTPDKFQSEIRPELEQITKGYNETA